MAFAVVEFVLPACGLSTGSSLWRVSLFLTSVVLQPRACLTRTRRPVCADPRPGRIAPRPKRALAMLVQGPWPRPGAGAPLALPHPPGPLRFLYCAACRQYQRRCWLRPCAHGNWRAHVRSAGPSRGQHGPSPSRSACCAFPMGPP